MDQQEIIKSTLGSLFRASSRLNKLLRENKPKLNPKHYATVKEVEESINEAIIALQNSNLKTESKKSKR